MLSLVVKLALSATAETYLLVPKETVFQLIGGRGNPGSSGSLDLFWGFELFLVNWLSSVTAETYL